MTDIKIKPGRIGEKTVNAYKNIEEKFVDRFLEKDEESPSGYTLKTGAAAEKAVAGYKKIEDAVVGGYRKVEDKFTEAFLEKDDDR